ncbi:MAG TPA: serine/threonine-protein kinase, partial [Gemmatimonadales bacterium]|nr:serine/threonine-protein kinase [Gemmatimonadales bacterium]
KVLPFSLAFDAEFVERFQREARTAAQLEHPNIIPIYRVGRSGRVIYFVMKFLRGGSLSTVLAERRTLSPPEIRRLLLEAGSALGYAAQRGIVHRDIKPDNIMFDEFGQCLLTDFGIAKAASGQRLTGTGMSIGTPHYMSPEQARAQAIDGRSDIYSLGVVAYQCLAGRVPYDGEDSFSIGYKHITEPIPTPQLITADERRLFEVIKRMLMKDPNDRFQACEELIAALQGQSVAAVGTIRAAAPGVTPPAIASQPTTPIKLQGSERQAAADRRYPNDRRDPGRRVADRSVAMRRKPTMPAWPWAVIALVGGGAGAFYYYLARGFAPRDAAAADSTRAGPLDSTQTPVVAPGATPRPGDTAGAIPRPADPGPRGNPKPPDPVPPPVNPPPPASTSSSASPDTGAIRLLNLPRGSSVLIDERPVSEPVTRLPPGLHVVAISAPRYQFYAETVRVEPGQELELRPVLTPLGVAPRPRQLAQRAPTCAPGPGYNADGSCFDERPRPAAQPFVPVPADAEGEARPSVLWVRVSPEGKTLEVRPFRPSNDAAFERDVRAFAMELAWQPAVKGGSPVEAWTQMIFRPAP